VNRPARLEFAPWSEAELYSSYDLLLASCGYEERARSLAEKLEGHATTVIALDYESHRIHSYEANKKFFLGVGSLLGLDQLDELKSKIVADATALNKASSAPAIFRIAVDISSMDRDRLARVVYILTHISDVALRIDFLYSSGEFSEGAVGSDGPVTVNQAISHFEGWSSNPDLPVACIIGLGFEHQLALAALETLEPSLTVALRASGGDARFDARVSKDNEFLLRNSSSMTVYSYDLLNPLATFRRMVELIGTMRTDYRLVLVPIGPKVFALICLLLATTLEDELSIWRVSSGLGRQAEDRAASGEVIGLTISISKSDD
jgi:hypothetical protein